jgi:hypothetical protein
MNETSELSNNRLTSASILLSFHMSKFPHVIYMPEFAQLKEREKAMLYSMTAGLESRKSLELYLNSVLEFHEAIESMTGDERDSLIKNSPKKGSR